MNVIQSITTDPLQNQTWILPDQTTLLTTIHFVPMQFGWFIRKLSYNGFIINNLRIVNSPNLLQQYRNQLPFGLACVSKNDREPSLQQDFFSGQSVLYILSKEEVQEYTRFLSGG